MCSGSKIVVVINHWIKMLITRNCRLVRTQCKEELVKQIKLQGPCIFTLHLPLPRYMPKQCNRY